MSKMSSLKKLGPLDVLEISGNPGSPCIFVFHGFGADASDLLSLAHLLNAPPGTRWIFAQGPLKVSDGGIAGRAWFPLDGKALDLAMTEGRHLDWSEVTPEGLKRVRVMAQEMIVASGVSPSKIVLMGFSQGAMLATDVALRLSEKVAGLGILSGTLLNKTLWKEKAKTKVGLPFFQSHGESDALLSVSYAKDLEAILVEGGLKGQLHIFRGGHEVPQEIIHKLGAFLRKILTPQN